MDQHGAGDPRGGRRGDARRDRPLAPPHRIGLHRCGGHPGAGQRSRSARPAGRCAAPDGRGGRIASPGRCGHRPAADGARCGLRAALRRRDDPASGRRRDTLGRHRQAGRSLRPRGGRPPRGGAQRLVAARECRLRAGHDSGRHPGPTPAQCRRAGSHHTQRRVRAPAARADGQPVRQPGGRTRAAQCGSGGAAGVRARSRPRPGQPRAARGRGGRATLHHVGAGFHARHERGVRSGAGPGLFRAGQRPDPFRIPRERRHRHARDRDRADGPGPACRPGRGAGGAGARRLAAGARGRRGGCAGDREAGHRAAAGAPARRDRPAGRRRRHLPRRPGRGRPPACDSAPRSRRSAPLC
jgi:hypothetical protein